MFQKLVAKNCIKKIFYIIAYLKKNVKTRVEIYKCI